MNEVEINFKEPHDWKFVPRSKILYKLVLEKQTIL